MKAYQYIDDNRETTMKVIINVQENRTINFGRMVFSQKRWIRRKLWEVRVRMEKCR